MAITFTLNLNTIQDVLYPLNSRVARISGTTAGSSGQLASISGVSGSAAAVNWSLTSAPSWMTIDSSGTINVAGVDISKIGIYEVSVFALDSSNPSNFSTYPLTVEVLPALYLRESTSLTTINVTALDSTVSNTINAYGSDNVTQLTDVNYFVVGSLFAGLNLRTSKDNAVLYGDLKSLSNLRGGVTSIGPSQTVQVKAFKPGTFHDHPDRAALLTLNYTVVDAAPGNIETAISGYVDSSSNPFIRLHARSEIRSGKGTVTTYAWSASGTATGTFLDSANASTTTWSPTATGQVTFTLVTGGAGTASPTYTPATLTLDIATGTSWTSSGKLKLIPSDVSKLETQGYSSQTTTFGTKLTDLQSGQTATLTPTVTPIGAAPAASAPTITVNGTPTNLYTDVNSTNGDIALISFTVPAGASIGDKYVIQISAATASSTRVGTLTYYVVCTGAQKVLVTPSVANFTINNGVSYTIASPIAVMSSSQSGMNFELVNAPAGLYLDSNGNLLGKAYVGQAGSMRIYYSKAGFLTEDYITIPFTINEVVGLISPTLSTTTPVIAPGSPLRVDWGFSGTALNFYLKKDSEPEIKLAGNITTYTFSSLSTNTTIGLRAVSAVGESFASPIDIIVSTSGIISRLPQSPTIAYLYQDNTIELNWSPIPIGSDSAHYYDYYGSWSVWYKYSSSSEILVPFFNLTGLESGGNLAARKVAFSLAANPPLPSDIISIDMQAISTNESSILSSFRWGKSDANPPYPMLSFPTIGTVSLDKDTASKSEPIKITIAGFTGDKWRVVFQDGNSTSFLPLSVNSMVISFPNGGINEQIRVEVESDYSSSLPNVRMRSVVNKSIFIIDQDYVAPSSTDPLGNIGFGGESGFEITDATSGVVALQPYISIVRSLVKDETTNELKLMVSTSRTQDGSSSLGTMALDVFPILGRPHIKDLIKPLSTTSYTSEILTPVKITTDLIQDIIIGQFTEIKLSSSGGTAPFSWYANSLPTGLSISTDGTIYGSVFQLGTYSISVSIADSSNPTFIDEKTFDLVVKSDLKITTTNVSNAVTNSLYSQALATSGGVGPFQWSLVGGELPIGLVVNPETGVIEGRASTYNSTTDFNKVFTFVVQAVDSVGARASKQLTMGLNSAALSMSSIDQDIIYRGERFRLTTQIFGGKPPYTGLVISDGSGVLSTANCRIQDGSIEFDIPETVSVGNHSFTASISDSVGSSVSRTFTYSVRPYLGEFRIIGSYIDNIYNTTENLDHFIPVTNVVGSNVTLTSGATQTNGLTVSYNDSTKQLNFKGPITVGQNLEVPVSLTIAGTSNDGVVTKTFTVNGYTGSYTSVSPGFKAVYTEPLKVGNLVTLDTFRPYFNSSTGVRDTSRYTRVQPGQELPAGLSLDSKTGLIYGTLVNDIVAATTLENIETASNTVLGSIRVNFNIRNDKTLILDSSNLGVAKRGIPYTGTVTALAPAQGPLSYSIQKGSLPSGILISVSGNSLIFSGTPTTGGFYDIWIEVSDVNGYKELLYKRFEVNYSSAVSIQTPKLTTIIVGNPYSFQLASIGGVTPYSYSIISGSLPSGITMSSSGLISGTTNASNFNGDITILVTDSNLSTDSKVFNVTTDPGYIVSTVTGTNSVGNWPVDQPDLSSITRINQTPTSPLKAFTIRVAGLSNNSDQIAIDDPNLAIAFTTIQTESGSLVGYARITNPSKSSPATLGIPVGTKNFNITIYNSATGRTKTQALSFEVLPVDSSTNQLKTITLDGLYAVTPRTGTDEMAFLETSSTSVALSTVSSPTYSVFIAGIDLATHPMDVISNGLVSVVEISSGLAGRFNISYNGVYTNKALIGLNYLGSEFGSPASNQYIRVRVNDVAYVDYTSGPTTFVMDVFQNSSSVVAPRDKKLNVLQLIKPTIASNSTSIFLDEPYTFQINFDAPLNLAQNPVVNFSGLQGVTSSSFITNTNGQKIGFKVQGLWAKNPAETYPKLYNVNISMTEDLMFVRNSGNSATSSITYFNQNISITVQVNNNALGISLSPWDTSSQVTGGYNLYAPNVGYNVDPGLIGNPPTTVISNYSANPQAYKIKIWGTDGSNPVCGNSILNLPVGIKFYVGGTYYTSADMYNTLLTGGIYVSSGTFLLTSITSAPSGSNVGLNFWQFPAPSVPLSTDYSTQAAIIANAIPIQTYTVPIKMELQEIATGKLATGIGNIVLKPSFGADPYRSGVLVLLHYPSGVSTTPDTFVVLAHYYDINNPNEYVSATFPYAGSNWGLVEPAKIYVIGQIPYLSSLTEQFSAITVTSGTGVTVTPNTISSDPAMIKASTYGLNLIDQNNNNVFYSKFFTQCYNSYTITFVSGTDVTVKTLSLTAYSGSAIDPNFSSWSNTGRKQGRMKYKPITINISQDITGGGGPCLPAGSEILMSDLSKKNVESIVSGDLVFALDEHTLAPVVSKVMKTYVIEEVRLVEVATTKKPLVCSKDHRLTRNNNVLDYPAAKDLEVGDILVYVNDDGSVEEVGVLNVETTEEVVTVYHISLEEGHVYVGNNFAAHNKGLINWKTLN